MEVLIIGGGPAGLAAAITVARCGLRTCLLSKKPLTILDNIFKPLESIHPGIESLLEALDVRDAVAASKRGTYTGIFSGSHFTKLSPDPAQTWTGYHICKSTFIKELAHYAQKLGVSIFEDERIISIVQDGTQKTVFTTSGKKFECEFLIDASGRSRYLGKKLKLREKFLSLPLTAYSGITVNVPPNLTDTIGTRFTPSKTGWTWFAPVPPDQCTWTVLAATKNGSLHPPDVLQPFTNSKRIYASNVRWRVFRPLFCNGMILTGDAAGILDPGTGQGILYALESGIMAGQTILKAKAEPSLKNFIFQEYDNWFMENYYNRAAQLMNYYKDLGISFHQ